MKLETRHWVYVVFLSVGLWVLYLSRHVLTPFVLAGLFAYFLNPLVNILTRRIRLPRTLSIAIVYLALVGLSSALILNLGVRLAEESDQFSREAKLFVQTAGNQIESLPDWIRPVVRDVFDSVRASLLLPRGRVMAYLPGAVNRTLSLFVFLVATFYFLKDGHELQRGLFGFLPQKLRRQWEDIAGRINRVLGDYLRGQLFLIVIMSTLTYLGLLLIGVRYGLVLAIFTGFAEIIPLIGPVVAAAVAAVVAFTDGFSRISANPVLDVAAVVALYAVLRQLEDLFVIPQVMGRMTRLHPLVVMFAVLAGGHLFGVVGFLVAVPIAASAKVILEYFLESAG